MAGSDLGAPPGRVYWTATALIAVDTLLFSLIVPALPLFADRLALSDTEAALIFAAFPLAHLAAALPAAALAERVGRRPLLIGAAVLLVGATLTFASADHPALLAAARALQGLAAGATWTAALAVIADTSPPDRLGFRIGLAETTGGAASLLAPPLGGLAIDAVGTRATFALAAVLPALVAPLAWAVPETRRAGARLAPARVVLPRLARQPEAVAGAAALAVSAGALALLEPLLPLDLASRLDLSSTGVGVVFAAGLFAYFICTPLAGRWSDRHGRQAPILVGGLALSASLPLLGVGPAAWVAAAFAVAGAGIGTMAAPTGPLLTEAVDRAGLTGMYGWSAGVINLVWAAGYALGPLLGGGLRAILPFWAVTVAAACAIAIAAVVLHRRLRGVPPRSGAVSPSQRGG